MQNDDNEIFLYPLNFRPRRYKFCLTAVLCGQFKNGCEKKEERMNLNCVRETDWHYSSSRAEYPFVFCQSSFMRKCECYVLGVFFSYWQQISHGRNKSINTQVCATIPNGSCPTLQFKVSLGVAMVLLWRILKIQ